MRLVATAILMAMLFCACERQAPRHTIVRHFWATKFEPDSNGGWLIIQERMVHRGERRCFYVVGFDSAGKVVTGVSTEVDSTFQDVFRLVRDGRYCPDTTIDPRYLPYPTPHPPSLPIRHPMEKIT